MSTPKNVLVIKPSSMGDILHLFPALALLRRAMPEAELDFLIHPAFTDLLDYSPWPVRRRIFFERKKLGRAATMLPEFRKLVTRLRRRRYDMVIDFQGLTRSALFAFLANGPSVGFAAPREAPARIFYRKRYPVAPEHALLRNFRLAEKALGETADFEWPMLRSNPRHAARLAEKTGELGDAPLVLLIPGARWASKVFPPELFARVAKGIAARNPEVRFVTVGTAEDHAAEETIASGLGNAAPLLPLAGKTSIGEMMELIRRADAIISNDSGPIHAAAAFRRPVFGFYGPTDPDKTGPFSPESRSYQAALDCIKCLKRHCPDARCHRLDEARIIDDVLAVLTPEFQGETV